MIKIEFTPQQVEELKIFYVLELDKIQKRAQEISGIIAKLGATPNTLQETAIIKPEKRSYVKKTKVVATQPPTEEKKYKPVKPKRSSRTRKPIAKKNIVAVENTEPTTKYNFTEFIKETLVKQNRVLTAKELTLFAIKNFEIQKDDARATRNNVSSILSRLAKGGKELRSIQKENIVGRSYGLTTWFDDNNQLISEFK